MNHKVLAALVLVAVSSQRVDAGRDDFRTPPTGPDALAPLGQVFPAMPCRTPLAAAFSRQKAYVGSNGLLQVLLFREDAKPFDQADRARRMGPALHVLLDGQGPWRDVQQSLLPGPVPTVVTRFAWSGLTMEQQAFAAAPEGGGFWMRVSVHNGGKDPARLRIASILRNVAPAQAKEGGLFQGDGKCLLRAVSGEGVKTAARAADQVPGPTSCSRLEHELDVPAGQERSFDLNLLGQPARSWDDAYAATAKDWAHRLAPGCRLVLGDPTLQYAFEASLRQVLMMIEGRKDHARVLKGLEHYYGANPYDTFQASRALDAVGLRAEAEELLRHQIDHLRECGVFEMWEAPQPHATNVDQWIVQGLAAMGLWRHYELWGDEAWLREIAPALVKAAKATLTARREHPAPVKQGAIEVAGLLPPCGGDGGLGHGYHWSQNAGPLAGVRAAALAARKLDLPEAARLEAGLADFQKAYDQVRLKAAEASALGMIPAFPGAAGDEAKRPLWGVVMSVTAFDAIPADDPAAMATLDFLRGSKDSGLHRNLGYSHGVWPYMSASVALWHMRVGEFDEAWRVLRAFAAHASPTVCWYEEQERGPLRGHGDSADVWAAATFVHLTRKLMAWESADGLHLCAGLPADWMAAGREVAAGNVPTSWGKCSFEIRFGSADELPASASPVTAAIQLPARKRPARVHLTLAPSQGRTWRNIEVDGATSHARDGRNLVLIGPSQRVKVRIEW